MRMFINVFVACAVVMLVCGRELDPAACAARFDVQRDKIIRTEESREMGARYLSELDVGSRHECRRLCCETETCDVFVYEEKSPGSCYLFNCGPPEDFRCKFTAHGNFSSGVLALSRRLAELEDQERLAPRPPAAPAVPLAPLPHAHHSVPQTTSTTTTLPPPPIRPVVTASNPPPPPPTTTHATQPPQRRCSRYQWECHTGGECIAVYNACDGIPQCADGSDEAPELGCPAAPPTSAPVRPERHTTPPALPPPVYPVQMYDSEAVAEASADAVAMAGSGERWPHRLLQAQPRRYPGTDSGSGVGSHIFSHKGGLVQEDPQLPAFEPPPPQPWPRRPAWPSHQGPQVGLENSGWGGWGRDWPDERRAWPAAPPMVPQPPPREPELPYLPGKTMPELPEMPVLYDGQRSMHDAPKKGLGLVAPPPPQPAPPAPPHPADSGSKKKDAAVQTETKESSKSISSSEHVPPTVTTQPPAHAKASAGVAPRAGGIVAEAQLDQHDGLSEHPPAAVMLLVLGVMMTGAMGVLVGCRARAARRRLRRGGKPFAHDADYLVNGMYL